MMKTESTTQNVSLMTPAIISEAAVSLSVAKAKFANSGNTTSTIPYLNVNPAISESIYDGEHIENTWDSLKSRELQEGPYKNLTEKVEAGLKLGETMTSSFPSMVIAFIVMCIQLFANLQKAQMDNVMNQLTLMLADMKRQIESMKAEQLSNFTKDMLLAGIETASAAVQLVGSSYSTGKLGTKITEQSTLNNKDAPGKTKLAIDAKSEALEGKTGTASTMSKNEALSSDGQKEIVTEINSVKENVKAANVKRQATDADSANDTITADELARKTSTIRSEVDFINARQQAITAASGLMKAFSPLAQGILGSEATAHQIKAREAENAKEINNSFSRQYAEAATGMRDVIMKLLGLLQDLQSMDPNNALASSRKMA
nr:hypothetical protein [uncultured Noviherbaspirillum sp.]